MGSPNHTCDFLFHEVVTNKNCHFHFRATFCKLFKQLDKNGDGTLSRDEIRELFKMSKCQYSQEDIEEIINAADKNKDGKISYEEFKNECT